MHGRLDDHNLGRADLHVDMHGPVTKPEPQLPQRAHEPGTDPSGRALGPTHRRLGLDCGGEMRGRDVCELEECGEEPRVERHAQGVHGHRGLERRWGPDRLE